MQKPQNISYNSPDPLGTSPEVPPINDNWQARRELAAALRRFNSATLAADVPTELLRSVTAKVLKELARIETGEMVHGKKAQAERIAAGQGALPHMVYEMSPVLGLSNALAPPMDMWQAGGVVHGRVTAGWAYEGPFGLLHGGVIALLFDQLLGTGAHVTGGSALTGRLTIHYHHTTPLNKPLRLVARLDHEDGRKKFMVGEIWADDVRTATCEGLFIAPRKRPDAASGYQIGAATADSD